MADCHTTLGNLLAKTGREAEAEDSYARAMSILEQLVAAPGGKTYRATLGICLGNRTHLLEGTGRLEAALRDARRALEIYETLGDRERLAHSSGRVGVLLWKMGRREEARKALRRGVEMSERLANDLPSTPAIQLQLGEGLLILAGWSEETGQYREVRPLYERARQIYARVEADYPVNHDHPWLRAGEAGRIEIALAKFLITCPDPRYRDEAEAIRLARNAAKAEPKDSGFWLRFGAVAFEAGEYAATEEAYRKAAGLGFKSADQEAVVHGAYGWFLANCPEPRFRDPARAVKYAERAVELRPRHAPFLGLLGQARYRAGDWAGAIAALDKVEALQSGGPASLFFRAMAHWQSGQKDRARIAFDRAADLMDKQGLQHHKALLRFRAEAAALLGIAETTTPKAGGDPPATDDRSK